MENSNSAMDSYAERVHQRKNLTKAQIKALKWLRQRNCDGVFDQNNCLVAAGEKAAVTRHTWNRLRDEKMIEYYMNNRRVRVTENGLAVYIIDVRESLSVDDSGCSYG